MMISHAVKINAFGVDVDWSLSVVQVYLYIGLTTVIAVF